MKKTIFYDRNPKKASASESELSVEDCRNWIEEIFKTYPETNFTKDVLKFVDDALKKIEYVCRFLCSSYYENLC